VFLNLCRASFKTGAAVHLHLVETSPWKGSGSLAFTGDSNRATGNIPAASAPADTTM